MSKRKKVIPTLAELKADLKEMTFRQKVDHLWTYYKGYLVGLVMAVLLVSVMVTAVINASKEIQVSGMLVNVTMTQEAYEYLTTDYFEVLGCEEDREVVELLSADFSSLSDPTSSEDNYYSSQKLILQVASGDMDYAIVDKLAIEFYANQQVFSDLRDIFPEEMMEQFARQDMLYYALEVTDDTDLDELEIDTEEAERIPIGIKMQNLAFTQEAMEGQECYFAATGHEPDKEQIVAVWEYILDWENR